MVYKWTTELEKVNSDYCRRSQEANNFPLLRLSALIYAKMQNAVHMRALSMWKPAERTAHLLFPALLTVLYSCHHCYLEMLLSEVSGAPNEGRFQQPTCGGISQSVTHLLEVLYSLSFWPDMIYSYARPRPLYPRERDPVTFVLEARWAPGLGLDRCRKSRPPRDSIPEPSCP